MLLLCQLHHVQAESAKDPVSGTVDLVAMISGQIGDTPSFGAGIVAARDRDRLYIVTANHVVRQGNETARNLQVRIRPRPARMFVAELLPQFDRPSDVAVVVVPDPVGQGIPLCSFGLDRLAAANPPKRGDDVFPVGNPNGVPWAMPVRPDAIADVIDGTIVFQSALIARGHSGGGLIGTDGALLGMIEADEPPYRPRARHGENRGADERLELADAVARPVARRFPAAVRRGPGEGRCGRYARSDP